MSPGGVRLRRRRHRLFRRPCQPTRIRRIFRHELAYERFAADTDRRFGFAMTLGLVGRLCRGLGAIRIRGARVSHMARFIHAYPYLMLSLTMLLLFFVALACCPRPIRPLMVLSGALAAPFALTSVLVVPAYWSPSRLAVLLAGPEDVLFSFASAGLASLASVWLLRHRVAFQPRPERIWWRYVGGAVGGLAVGDLCWRLGGGPMTATVTAFGALVAVILWRRREFWPLFIAGVFGYAIVYVTALKLWYVLVPGFKGQWNIDALWGPVIMGVPLDEIVWSAAFGGAWPLFAMYLFDARLRPARKAMRDGNRPGPESWNPRPY